MRLRKERKAAGLSQHQLAGLAGVSQGSVSKLETGELVRPSYETLHRLAWALQKVGRRVEPQHLQPKRQLTIAKGNRQA